MITRKMRMAALVLAAGISGTAQAALQGRDLNGSIDSFEAYYDTVLDITWLADANYAQTSGYENAYYGRMTWENASIWAANLNFHDAVNKLTYDNWRLPTVEPINGGSFNHNFSLDGSTDNGLNITSTQSEMAYMFYVNLGNIGSYTPDGVSTGCGNDIIRNYCLDNVGPFSNLKPETYWSDSNYAFNQTSSESYAWTFFLANGQQFIENASWYKHAWAVSDGDVGVAAAVPEADTWAMLLAGLGLVGVATRRRKLAKV